MSQTHPSVQKKQKRKKKAKRAKNTQVVVTPLPKALSAPVASSITLRSHEPRFIQRSHKSCRVVHRELVDPVTFPGDGFQIVLSLPIQPGNDETFSWLSNVAINWERYRFHKLEFHYLTRTSTTVAGSVILSPDYNASAPPPLDEITAMSYQDSIEDSSWKNITIKLSPSNLDGGMKSHFVRLGPLGANQDIKTYDCGNLFVCGDVTNPTTVGKLIVDYDVEFFNPQLPPTGDPLVGGIQAVTGGTPSKTTPLGSAPVNSILNTLGSVQWDFANQLNYISFTENVKLGLMAMSAGGVGLSGAAVPVITKGPGTVKEYTSGVANSSGNLYNATWLLQDITSATTMSLPVYSGTSVNNAILTILRSLPGLMS